MTKMPCYFKTFWYRVAIGKPSDLNKYNNWFCHVRLFEQRCIALMDSMYNENTRHAMDLMDDEAIVWGIRSSPLTFAHENFMYEIVAHTCSQKNMNKLWYNNLPPDLKPFLKVDSLTQLIIDLCLLGT